MKFSLAAFSLNLALLSLAHGAGLIVDFDSYNSDDNLAGQGGWYNTGASNTSGVSWVNGSPFPVGSGGNAGQLGFQEFENTTARVSHGLSQVMDGATFSVTMLVQDSSNLFPNRDQFGFSLRSGGQELFGLYFTPTSQTATPNGVLPPRVDNVSWANFTTGTSAAFGTLTEGQYTTIEIDFTALSPDSMQFAMSSAGVPLITQTINSAGIGSATIDEFSAVWNLFDTVGGSEGGNSIYFDDLSIVPEPSAAALGLLGAASLLRRRRR